MNKPSITEPFWVQATIGDCHPFFAQLHRLCSKATTRQLRSMTKLLTAKQIITLDDADMWVENTGFSEDERKLKDHLESFAISGFQLDSFRTADGSGVYYRDDQYCFSMLQKMEAGFIPAPNIALDRQNTPVYNQAGHLLDVFVPILQEGVLGISK
ncbi:hypothetical protein [Spirosoma jeollabukense]